MVIGPGAPLPALGAGWSGVLRRDRWDDWDKYCTQFYLSLVDPNGEKHPIGNVKIGEVGLKPHAAAKEIPPGHRRPNIRPAFEALGENFFSVGQEETYYETLTKLGDSVREEVLRSLADVAFDSQKWELARDEYVMGESLLRFITVSTVTGQFSRMAHGGARLTKFRFTYSPPKRLGDGQPPYALEFHVDPESPVPSNVHVLIGRNGVGKTYLLALMAKSLVAPEASSRQSGTFLLSEMDENAASFANVVAVSFSAFDEAELLPEAAVAKNALGYSYIGLRRPSDSAGKERSKSPEQLANEFVESLTRCQGISRRRWEDAIKVLQSDPVFRAADLLALITKNLQDDKQRAAILKTFKRLSSGHKIVLLTMTRRVEKVEERTLVLIDEPEAHLHPPLLSAMIRALSKLMTDRNGVAVVATHSPVILQEVPRQCVWVLNRTLSVSSAERPSVETFAEGVGILSREVFQLELSQSGYHQILESLRRRHADYQSALYELGEELGSEGRAVLQAMFLTE